MYDRVRDRDNVHSASARARVWSESCDGSCSPLQQLCPLASIQVLCAVEEAQLRASSKDSTICQGIKDNTSVPDESYIQHASDHVHGCTEASYFRRAAVSVSAVASTI
jgi:hypothetical protein